MIKLHKDMLLQLEHLGIGIIASISEPKEVHLGPENSLVDSTVIFNTYSIDVLIEDRMHKVTVTVVHEQNTDDYRIDWGTTKDSGTVKILGSS